MVKLWRGGKYFLVIVNFYEIRVKYLEALSRSCTVVNHIKPGFKELLSKYHFYYLLDNFRKFYDELKNKGLLVPLSSDIEGRRSSEAGTVDYVMPEGSSSIVKHFFQKSGIKIQFDHFVENIQLLDNKWNVVTKVCSIKTLKLLLL
jgi:hypothetical protein